MELALLGGGQSVDPCVAPPGGGRSGSTCDPAAAGIRRSGLRAPNARGHGPAEQKAAVHHEPRACPRGQRSTSPRCPCQPAPSKMEEGAGTGSRGGRGPLPHLSDRETPRSRLFRKTPSRASRLLASPAGELPQGRHGLLAGRSRCGLAFGVHVLVGVQRRPLPGFRSLNLNDFGV